MSEPKRKHTVQSGDILAGKYRVERVLGEGGMGVVVAAEHLELNERVAIKFLLDDVDLTSEHAERFLREARAAVKIKSEHVARVIDVGRLPNNAPYMVMEYLEGCDLSTLLDDGRVAIDEAVDYIVQASEAMSVAHGSGIIHRDLKPANLFLTRRPDGSKIIKVLDFGISKVTTGDAAKVNLTQTAATMGSPLYMSPEQVRSTRNVDQRTDIWALGVILYELLVGAPPFNGGSLGEVFAQVMTDNPKPPRALRPEIPAGLEAIVLRCLEKNPDQRFVSVEALVVALAPFASRHSTALIDRLSTTFNGAANTLPPVAAEPSSVDVVFSEHLTAKTSIEADITSLVPGAPEAIPGGTKTSWTETKRAETAPPGAKPRPRWQLFAAAGIVLVPLAYVAFGAVKTPTPAAEPAAAAVVAPVVTSPGAAPVHHSAAQDPSPQAATPSAEPMVVPAPTPVVAPAPASASAALTTSPSPAVPHAARTRTPRPNPAPNEPAAKTNRKPLSIDFK